MNSTECSLKRRNRPTIKLYVPPAGRNKTEIKKDDNTLPLNESVAIITKPDSPIEDCSKRLSYKEDKSAERVSESKTTANITKDEAIIDEKSTNTMENLENKLCNVTISRDEEIKVKEEAPILNVNRKSKPLIKPVKKKDILQIDVKKSIKSIKKSPVKLVQVANWEDLFSEDDQEDSFNEQLKEEFDDDSSEEETEQQIINPKMQELEHVIELYDFPSAFRTQDLMQIYNIINKESMYIKWCDETHALLILGSAIQANRALMIQNDFIKSRPMTMAGSVATQVAYKSDLKPAMKRPPTTMLTARRMITTALGTTSSVSREVQQKEREALRIAKELKRAQKQSEIDAWEGHPRPSTA